MKHLRLISLLIVIFLSVAVLAAPPGWEDVSRMPAGIEHIESEDAWFAASHGYIYVKSSRAVPVRVLTILGQTVEQVTLPPGSHRFRPRAKGIYLIKIGTVTRRVTV